MAVNPTGEQIGALQALAGTDADGPLVMLNLNTYRDRDEYERYGRVALEVLQRVGGEVLWAAPATMTVIGGPDDGCDEVIAVRYPSAQAFLALALDPEILAALPHRTAGLMRAKLIRCDDAPLRRSPGTTDPPRPGTRSMPE
jgi:uncharacterized protein (DUF1330 family)